MNATSLSSDLYHQPRDMAVVEEAVEGVQVRGGGDLCIPVPSIRVYLLLVLLLLFFCRNTNVECIQTRLFLILARDVTFEVECMRCHTVV